MQVSSIECRVSSIECLVSKKFWYRPGSRANEHVVNCQTSIYIISVVLQTVSEVEIDRGPASFRGRRRDLKIGGARVLRAGGR